VPFDNQGAHQGLAIDPVGLRPPTPARGQDRRGVDHVRRGQLPHLIDTVGARAVDLEPLLGAEPNGPGDNDVRLKGRAAIVRFVIVAW
jgi:hypothetical protein